MGPAPGAPLGAPSSSSPELSATSGDAVMLRPRDDRRSGTSAPFLRTIPQHPTHAYIYANCGHSAPIKLLAYLQITVFSLSRTYDFREYISKSATKKPGAARSHALMLRSRSPTAQRCTAAAMEQVSSTACHVPIRLTANGESCGGGREIIPDFLA